MQVSLIVAATKSGAIGKNNQLLWHLSDDLKLFKKRTQGHTIIMGRKTFDSIGKPLPNRTNIIISRNKNLEIPGCLIASSLKDAIGLIPDNEEEIFIIGGEQIFKLAESYATHLYLTLVQGEFPDADTFFDFSPYKHWKIISKTTFHQSEKNQFDFEVVEMIKN